MYLNIILDILRVYIDVKCGSDLLALQKENEYLKRDLESQKKITELQDQALQSLKDQVAMYKKMLDEDHGHSKPA